jgi:hypothetical protein
MSKDIAKRIQVLRGQLAILDVDLADLFGVTPGRLIERVKRDQPEVPVEFAFSIEPDELQSHEPRVVSLAFTEHGVIIAAGAVNTPHAMEMSIQVVRVFVKLRESMASDSELLRSDGSLANSERVLH